MDSLMTYGCILAAYLLGAIPFGLLVARLHGVADIRTHGSGNIGATNVWRVINPRAGVLVYVLDFAKGIGSVLLAQNVPQPVMQRDLFLVVSALAAVIGHVFPVYLAFKGGKGVSTGLGVMITLLPAASGIAILVFAVVVSLTRFVSLGSILGSFSLCAVIAIEKFLLSRPVASIYLLLSLAFVAVVLFTHRENIGRLLRGTERRFSLSSRSVGKGDS